MQELGVLHRCWETPGKSIITALEGLLDVISTFRDKVVEDALFSLKRTEEARIEWMTMHEGLSKQMASDNAGKGGSRRKEGGIEDDVGVEGNERRGRSLIEKLNFMIAEAATATKIVDDCKAEYDRRRQDLETKVIILNEKR
jgi:hypothetical protein